MNSRQESTVQSTVRRVELKYDRYKVMWKVVQTFNKERMGQTVFEEVMAGNSPELIKDSNPQTPITQQIPSKTDKW